MIKALPDQLSSVILNNDNMYRYLLNLSIEKPPTERSWLYENKSPDEVLQMWMETLSQLEKGDTFSQEVFHFDTSQLEKWGPQGGHAPMKELYPELIEPTFSDHPPIRAFESKLWKQCMKTVSDVYKQKYSLRHIRPASYKHVIDDMRLRDTLESNSGWPDFARRNLPEVKKAAEIAARTGAWENYPALALFRSYNLKTRLVWMFPMSSNLVEGSLTQPLQSRIITVASKSPGSFYSPWVGFNECRKLITWLYDTNKFVYATDFSATDAHFREETSMQAAKVIASISSVEAHPRLIDTVHNMHHIPLVISPTEYVIGEHGVSSGSNWTNVIETIFDAIFVTYVRQLINVYGVYGIGDDICWASDVFVEDFDKRAESLANRVGQEVQAEKVSCSPNKVKTLQRLFQRGYRRPDGQLRGVYSTVRALKSSIYPEKFHKPKNWSSDMFCARQYMILENCVDHPLFEEFVKFVVRGQKDLIPFSRKSRRDLDRILRETRLLPGFNPTYNQEKRDTSLAAFQSIAIAKTL